MTKKILLVLLAFLAASASGGGFTFILSRSGMLIGGLPLSILGQSPFVDFLIPGNVLFVVLGLFPAIVVFALIKMPKSRLAEYINFCADMNWAWSFSVYTAFALVIWLQVEAIYVGGVGSLQMFYTTLAVAILFVVLLPSVRNIYKKVK